MTKPSGDRGGQGEAGAKQLPPRAKRMLAEASARLTVRDIKRRHALRDELSPSWWEWTASILVFPAALGAMMTLVRLVEFEPFFEGHQRNIMRFLYGWIGFFVLALMASYDSLQRRHRAMRRFAEEVAREAEETRREVAALKKRLDESARPRPESPAVDSKAAASSDR